MMLLPALFIGATGLLASVNAHNSYSDEVDNLSDLYIRGFQAGLESLSINDALVRRAFQDETINSKLERRVGERYPGELPPWQAHLAPEAESSKSKKEKPPVELPPWQATVLRGESAESYKPHQERQPMTPEERDRHNRKARERRARMTDDERKIYLAKKAKSERERQQNMSKEQVERQRELKAISSKARRDRAKEAKRTQK